LIDTNSTKQLPKQQQATKQTMALLIYASFLEQLSEPFVTLLSFQERENFWTHHANVSST
jgi:hypothetical protein